MSSPEAVDLGKISLGDFLRSVKRLSLTTFFALVSGVVTLLVTLVGVTARVSYECGKTRCVSALFSGDSVAAQGGAGKSSGDTLKAPNKFDSDSSGSTREEPRRLTESAGTPAPRLGGTSSIPAESSNPPTGDVGQSDSIRVFLPMLMSGATVTVDSAPATIVNRTMVQVDLEVPRDGRVHTIEVRKGERVCRIERTLRNGIDLAPCQEGTT